MSTQEDQFWRCVICPLVQNLQAGHRHLLLAFLELLLHCTWLALHYKLSFWTQNLLALLKVKFMLLTLVFLFYDIQGGNGKSFPSDDILKCEVRHAALPAPKLTALRTNV